MFDPSDASQSSKASDVTAEGNDWLGDKLVLHRRPVLARRTLEVLVSASKRPMLLVSKGA